MSAYLRRGALHRLLRYQLRRSMARFGVSLTLGRKALTATSHRADVTLLRDNGRIEIALPADPAHVVFMQRESITAYLYLLANCPPSVMAMSCACSDGHEASAARFTQSSRTQHPILVPDRYFILRNGFNAERALADTAGLPWAQRSDIIVWRGAANGEGIHPQTAADAANPRIVQRARLCMLAKPASGIDAKLTSSQTAARLLDAYAPLGIVGEQRPEAQWLGDKFAIDIDGWTNAWSNLIIRMHFGCCVLKVASADGYRQWWYDRLLPWVHYVPVRADMADLLEKIDWVRSNESEAQAIAARGQQLVRSMTLPTETAMAVQAIEQNWNTN